MRVTTVDDIISKEVLNENTGELEKQEFKRIKTYKYIRGGFRMVYKTYDEALLSLIKSNKDLEIWIYLRDSFTYKQVEKSFRAAKIAKMFKVSRQKITTFLKKIVDVGLLLKIDKFTYRLNPFMYIPFRADAEELQKEWRCFEKIEDGQIEPA